MAFPATGLRARTDYGTRATTITEEDDGTGRPYLVFRWTRGVQNKIISTIRALG